MKNNGFKSIVGHTEIIGYIQNAVKENKVSHAYILNGERGSGKRLLSNLFAMTLECQDTVDADPCYECHACKQILSGNNPDVIRVTHEKPNSIGVDDIRTQVNEDIQIKPYSNPYKIYIIPDADLMTLQAQNAILKTIEEPPAYAILILLTENAENLLPTIRSRCVMLKLRNVKDKLIKKYLMEQMEIPDYRAGICASFAQGNMGRAIMLATSDHFTEIKEAAVQLVKYIHEMQEPEVIKAVKRMNEYKMDISDYLDIFAVWYRDVLLYKATKDINGVIFSDELEAVKREALRSSYEHIEDILKAIDKAKMRLKANVNFDTVIELLLATIKEN